MAEQVLKAIAAAASATLSQLGLFQRGRSRVWIDDRGWWLINVEFQPSSGRQGCYLNVGHQHLWVSRDHLIFDDPERPLGAANFVRFAGDLVVFEEEMAAAAALAAKSVVKRRSKHGEGWTAVEKIAAGPDDLEGGVALSILGRRDQAEARLAGRVHPAYMDQAQAYSFADPSAADALARQAVEACRTRLRLPPGWLDWTA